MFDHWQNLRRVSSSEYILLTLMYLLFSCYVALLLQVIFLKMEKMGFESLTDTSPHSCVYMSLFREE